MFTAELEDRKVGHRQRVDEARARGHVRQCAICVREDVLPEEVVHCELLDEQTQAAVHVMCNQCCRAHVDALLQNG